MPYLTSDERIRKAEAWLQKRIERINPALLRQYQRRGSASYRLKVPARVIDLYKPYHSHGLIVTDSVRRLAQVCEVRATMLPPIEGRRHSLIFVFEFKLKE